ncbi:Oidioi.mRNA.OKI2018_I69.PAR.g9572.t1.cds [Oikopleura dioica]|uniref:Oidioi.mRNA.OKI2018_I69.PAR.g9572.t1.cds n=1 Tax=Oikopleura dioica TaxID=34765 RepID=A0ABN7RS44_OIKDI|nr:Oidioi.mRNA.OKI2018_I69.PAR.g9572.t1.cds [Oikopleura dioica]
MKLSLMIFVFVPVIVASGSCSEYWYMKLDDYVRTDWRSARKICELMGGTLPFFTNTEDYDQFMPSLQHDVWLGVRVKGRFPNRRFPRINSKNFSRKHPYSCISLNKTGWIERRCKHKLRVACRFAEIYPC